MNQIFQVGEIAIICGLQFEVKYNGCECEILQPIKVVKARGRVTRKLLREPAYLVRMIDGVRGYVPPENLRKRPAPPDWNKLADPRELPIGDKVDTVLEELA